MEDKATVGTSIVSVDETVRRIKDEVQSEFVMSQEKVYKEALRGIILQENAYIKQVDSIKRDLGKLNKIKTDLEEAFKAGELISREDAQRIVKRSKSKAFKPAFGDDGDDD